MVHSKYIHKSPGLYHGKGFMFVRMIAYAPEEFFWIIDIYRLRCHIKIPYPKNGLTRLKVSRKIPTKPLKPLQFGHSFN